jgi:copper transport protein
MRRVLLVAVVALAFPGTAWAHATLLHTTPKVGQRLAGSPRVITLEFDQSVRVLANGIQVFDAKGRLVSGPPRVSPGDPRVVEAALLRVPRGGYTVRWATISNDSHVGRGVFTFGVRAPAPPIGQG